MMMECFSELLSFHNNNSDVVIVIVGGRGDWRFSRKRSYVEHRSRQGPPSYLLPNYSSPPE